MKGLQLVVLFFAATAPLGAQLYPSDPMGSTSTHPTSINPKGALTGFCYLNFRPHGFVRDPQGNITPFDPDMSTATLPTSINPSGAITGYYYGASSGAQGFVRDPQGNVTTFPPAGSGSIATYPQSINPSGAVTGSYYDANGLAHGFVRDSQGNFTPFDPKGSTSTNPTSINPGGAITGSYYDANGLAHGFVRDPQGNITSFPPTGSTGTYPQSINPAGTVTGRYFDANHVARGFVWDPQGNFTPFDPKGSTSTNPTSINPSGAITGSYNDANGLAHGFMRDPQGNITPFPPTGSTATYSYSINPSGTVTGYYHDNTSGVDHGFAGTVPNGMDVSSYSGAVSDTSWQSAMSAGVSYAVVQAWGGGTQNSLAEDQLLGAQGSGLATGAYALLNYFSQDSAEDQVGQAIEAIGSAITDLKFIAVDVEVCCGEFTSWQPSHWYSVNNVIMDPANHIQKVIKAGRSGTGMPSWNDTGGTTKDGTRTLTWQDTGKVVVDQADRVAMISAAVSYIQQNGLQAVIYTDGPKKNWQAITGNCGTSSTNNCSALISLPLWDVEHKTFYAGDGLLHCGDGIAGLVPFTPYSSTTWQARSGNQYDWGFAKPASSAVAPSWDEYELGIAPAAKAPCGGDTLFGLPAVDLDYFNPALFQ